MLTRMLNLVKRDQNVAMETRLFRLLCFAAAALSLFAVIPTNLFLHITPWVNVAVLGFGLTCLALYSVSLRGKDHFFGFYLLLLLLLNGVWFLDSGSDGCVGYFFFAAVVYPLAFWRGRKRWLLVGFFLLNVWALQNVDHVFPQLITRFASPADRLLDLMSGFGTSMLAAILMFWFILSSYDQEKESLHSNLRRLEDAQRVNADIIDFLPDATVVLDLEHRVIAWNRAMEELTGTCKEEMLGRGAFAYAEPFYGQPRNILADYVLEGTMPEPGLYVGVQQQGAALTATAFSPLLQGPDGTHFSILAAPLFDRDGRMSGAIESIRDITHQIKAERNIHRSEEELRRIMELLPVGIVWIDPDGNIEFANQRLFELFGEPCRSLATTRQLFGRLYPDPWARECALQKWQQSIAGTGRGERSLVPSELPITRRDGSVRHTILNTLVMDRRVVVLFTDITDREQLHSEMIKRQKLESLGLLAGGIAHDFNNILTCILGNLSVSQLYLGNAHRACGPLREAEKASGRAAELSRQLLTFARGGEPVKKPVDPAVLVKESISLTLRGTHAVACLDLAADLHGIEADEGQLSQVFNNLLINAVQAMPAGGKIQVIFDNTVLSATNRHSLPAGVYVRMTFADAGCGIAEADLGKIFDPYFTTKSTGTGLGLASVHSIVSRHGGSVRAQSTPGLGSTFELLLPAAAPRAANSGGGRDAGLRPPTFGGKILVMDDEEMIRMLAEEMLGALGYQAESCRHGEEAVERYAAARERGVPYDAAILDLTVAGGMGGLKTAEKIRDLDPEACLIVSSGYSNDPVIADFASYGFCAVLTKPYRSQDVDRILRAVHGQPVTV